jgi:hypothetical protein
VAQCTFPGCTAKPLAKGLCTGHYQQKRDGKSLTPLKRPLQDNFPVVNGKKECRSCGELKPVNDFYQPKGRKPTLDCKPCYTDKVMKRRS